MNTTAHTSAATTQTQRGASSLALASGKRIAGAGFAAILTLSMLLGVDGLARVHNHSAQVALAKDQAQAQAHAQAHAPALPVTRAQG